MKTLKFRPNLVELILTGKKTVTWRLLDDKNLTVGDELEFVNKGTMEKFASAVIVGIREKRLGDIAGDDFEGHETYESRDDMFKEMVKNYGDKINGDTIVKIVEFKLV
jgi:hypothetical protein